jgi:hypothetical protein
MPPEQSPARQAPERSVNTNAVQAAIDRVMMTYDLLATRTEAERVEAREQLIDYLAKLHTAGETDLDRLTVCGLTYLRERDGSIDQVKAGFTGL